MLTIILLPLLLVTVHGIGIQQCRYSVLVAGADAGSRRSRGLAIGAKSRQEHSRAAHTA
jgi:hypothetical protein